MRKLYSFLLPILFALPLTSHSQILAWNLNGITSGASTAVSTTSDPNLNSGSTLTMGPGITASSLSNGFAATKWAATSQSSAETIGDYFQFTLSAAGTSQVSLTNLIAWFRRSSTGPNTFQWEYSLDGFSDAGIPMGPSISYIATTTNGDQQPTLDLSGTAALQNVAAGTTITIRLYGWGASSTGGTFAIGRPSGANSLALNGTVTGGTAPTVNPPAGFTATTASSTEIDLTGTADAAGDNILIAYNTTNVFGTPSGALTTGATISGGGTVLYNGSASALPFQHTGLTPSTQYFYSAWSVDASNDYSTALTANAITTNPVTHNIVINQVYGGGGNSGAQYSNDFIELYNNENNPVNLGGWSIQYASATGTGTWLVTPLTGTIPAKGFFLIQLAAGATPSGTLPSPDLVTTGAAATNMSATAGKVLLANTTQQMTGTTPQTTGLVVDLVGYGSTANDFETAPAPGLTNTTSITRVPDGFDHNNNSTDFQSTVPNPRNAAYSTTPPAVAALSPANGQPDVPVAYQPYLVATKPLVKGSGSITLYTNGTPGTAIDVSNTAITVSNDTVYFNLPLSGGNTYAITLPAGTFTDAYSLSLPGLTTTSAWSFTTYNNAIPAALPYLNDFETCTGNGLLSHGFTEYNVTGAQIWNCAPFGADTVTTTNNTGHDVEMNGYANSIDNLNEDWLVSPRFDLSSATYPLLSFWSRNAFAGAPLQLMISTDYTGAGDPRNATWAVLNGKFPSVGSDTWTRSANINLMAYKQSTVYLAFVYTSTTQDGSRWDLDDITLVNSATPPPPTLTLSAADMEFGYTAPGTPITKRLTVTGNDLTSDITITSEGSYTLSTDSVTFSNSVIIGADTANNLPEPVFVRFNPATTNSQFIDSVQVSINDSTAIVDVQGNSIDPATTLSVVDWNLNWFGTPDTTLGVANKSLQETNVATILPSLHADLYALEEVVNQHALDSIVATMPGYAYIIGQYGSYSNPAEPTADPLNEIQKLAFVYNTAKISPVRTDSLLTLGVTNPADITTQYYNDWASGRFPYMLTADVQLTDPTTGNPTTNRIHFINVHAKSNLSPVLTSYARRQDGAHALDSLLKAVYDTANVMILGDFNDDLNQTITAGVNPPVTSWNAFTITDSNLYKFPTKPLSPTGQHSDVNYSSVIDNVIVNNSLASWYLPSSATVLSNVASLVTNYGTTTTDHYPVFSQFSFTPPVPLPVQLVSFTGIRADQTAKLTWVTTSESNSKLFNVQRSSNGSAFTTIGTVAAQGNTSLTTTYTYTDAQPLQGDDYYRLQQVDVNGKFTYSNTIHLNFSATLTLQIDPNPVHGTANLYIGNASQALSIQLFSGNGQLLRQWSVTPGQTTLPVDVSGLAKGLYTVKAISATGIVIQKLLVQ